MSPDINPLVSTALQSTVTGGAQTTVARTESLADMSGQWQQEYQRAQEASALNASNDSALKTLSGPLDGLGETSASIKAEALAMKPDAKPSEVIHLTMRCHEFLFRCELTSNVANKSSDGVQQLFKQQ